MPRLDRTTPRARKTGTMRASMKAVTTPVPQERRTNIVVVSFSDSARNESCSSDGDCTLQGAARRTGVQSDCHHRRSPPRHEPRSPDRTVSPWGRIQPDASREKTSVSGGFRQYALSACYRNWNLRQNCVHTVVRTKLASGSRNPSPGGEAPHRPRPNRYKHRGLDAPGPGP